MPAQRRNLTRQLGNLYAWIATVAGREELITVDVPAPGGIGSRPLLLVAENRPEAMRYAPYARRYLDAIRDDGSTVARVDLQIFGRAADRKPTATLRATQPERRG